MKVVFTFDDGRDDSFLASNILKANNLTGTFYLTTGFVDGSFSTNSFGNNRKSINFDDISVMNKNGMEVASHGDKHVMEKSDFLLSYSKLKKIGVAKEKIGFSVPNSSYSEASLLTFWNDLSKNLSYIRVGRSDKCYSIKSKIFYVLYHIFKLQIFYNCFNKHNLNLPFVKNKINSVVIKRDINVRNIVNFVNKYSNVDAVIVLMFHSIVDKPKNKWEYSIKKFRKLCKKIEILCEKHSILNETLSDVVNEYEK